MAIPNVEAQQDAPTSPRCWCCGQAYPEADLVRLGQHPEVGVCARCAHWLHRRAQERIDEHQPGPAAWARGGVRRVRAAVMHRGWHDRPLVGPLLRWIDRHLP